MDDTQIANLVKQACDQVLENDSWLLVHNLSEQSIAHRVACYIEPLFQGYNVDCEYNGNAQSPNGRKHIYILKEHLASLGLLKVIEASEVEKELTDRAVFPDIIIHRRGDNENNKCIIEMKKSTSVIKHDYDLLKLKMYTATMYGNGLYYQLGIFIEAIISQDSPKFMMRYFKDGSEVNLL